jgi:hypothetical protein
MDTEIVLEREGMGSVLSLDEDEHALMQEITINPEPAVKKQFKRPKLKPPRNRYVDREEEIPIDAFVNPTKASAPSAPPPEEFDYGGDMQEDSEEEYTGHATQPEYNNSSDDEKADLLNKLARLEKRGSNVNKRLNMYSPIQDIRAEVKRLTYTLEVDQAVKFSRRALVACVTGLEFLNKRYNPLEVHLEGWSESIMENVDDYDDVFEELHNKYKGNMEMAPEVKLIMMLGGSATMFHLTNSMFKAAMPNMNDVIKQNPDLVKNMMSAVQNTQPRSAAQAPPQQSGERREMRGPAMDISSLMNGIMMPPPPPVNSTPHPPPEPEQAQDNESVSDIVSMISGDSETRDINVPRKRGRPRKAKTDKKEIAL